MKDYILKGLIIIAFLIGASIGDLYNSAVIGGLSAGLVAFGVLEYRSWEFKQKIKEQNK